MSWKSIADLIGGGGPGRDPWRAHGGGLGDSGPLRPRPRNPPPGPAALQHLRCRDAGRSCSSRSATSATCRSQGVTPGRRLRADPRRRRRRRRRAPAHPPDRRQQRGDPPRRPRARTAARQGRPDHARRPFRPSRDGRRADERQSDPLPDRGRAARRQYLPDRPRPVRQHGADARRRASPSGSASTRWRTAWSAGSSPCSTTPSPASSISTPWSSISTSTSSTAPNAPAPPAPAPAECRPRCSSPRPGGWRPSRRVKLVDLTEFDPSLDVSDITALTAGRWVCEVLAGFAGR